MTSVVDFVRRISIVFLLACAIGILFFSVKWMTDERDSLVMGEVDDKKRALVESEARFLSDEG